MSGSTDVAQMPLHQQRERHFRAVSRAFMALSALTLVGIGASLMQEHTATPSALYTQPAVQGQRTAPVIAPSRARLAGGQRDQTLGAAPKGLPVSLVLEEPAQTPAASLSRSNQWGAGGLMGAAALAAGLVFLATKREAARPAGAFDPLLVGPVAPVAMISAAAEGGEPSLIKKPALKPATAAEPSFVTVEYQRRQAKALFEHFERLEEAAQRKDGQRLGWTTGNEIANGRWVMFGWLVGMLTEYATGVSFVEQIKLTLNNLAILDLD